MILGYIISGEFNDSQMFDKDLDKHIPFCNKCLYVTNFEYISPIFKLKKNMFDYSTTYDSHTIVSARFKDFCIRSKFTGLEFKKLPNEKYYFSFFIRNIKQFDTDKIKLNYEDYCDVCKNYKSITPALPLVLKNLTEPLDEGFFATDISFASGNEKKPVYFIGIETYKKMKKERFKGIHYLKFDTELTVPWK